MNNNTNVIKFPVFTGLNSSESSKPYKSIPETYELKIPNDNNSYKSETFLVADIFSEERDDNEMNSIDDILLKYIDSLDKKYDALKNDMVESEKRIIRNNKDLEERLEKRYIETNNNINKLIDKMNTLDSNLDCKLEKMNEKIDSNNKFIISISFTTIIGIAAMIITVILTIKSMRP